MIARTAEQRWWAEGISCSYVRTKIALGLSTTMTIPMT